MNKEELKELKELESKLVGLSLMRIDDARDGIDLFFEDPEAGIELFKLSLRCSMMLTYLGS
jgi:hypothetical protein